MLELIEETLETNKSITYNNMEKYQEMECNYMQGYYFECAVPVERVGNIYVRRSDR